MRTPEYYLQEGEFTGIGPGIRELSESLAEKGLPEAITEFLNSDKMSKSKHKKWEKTADELVEKGILSGCTDAAIVFLSLMRARGIPSQYVETVREDMIADQSEYRTMHGHVFARIYVDGKWQAYDPLHGPLDEQNHVFERGSGTYVEIAHGLDHSCLESRFRPGEIFSLLTVGDRWNLVELAKESIETGKYKQ